MEQIVLTGTDLKVSPICLGAWQFNGGKYNGTWEDQSLEVSKAIVDKSFDVGINFFDTAEGYAQSEVTLGKCLQGRRRDAVIATKYGFREGINTPPYSAEDIDNCVTKRLSLLQTDYLDILQIHFPAFIKDMKETVAELDRQIARGRIRYYGLSNFGPKNLQEILSEGGKPISNQMSYNLLWRSIENEVLPFCREKNISVFAYSPLQQGLLTGKYKKVEDVPIGRRRVKLFSKDSCSESRHGLDGAEEELFEAIRKIEEICNNSKLPMSSTALSWALQQPGVQVAIVGASSPEQVERNVKTIKLSQDIITQLNEVTNPLKVKIGKSLDQWCHPDRCE